LSTEELGEKISVDVVQWQQIVCGTFRGFPIHERDNKRQADSLGIAKSISDA